MNHKEKRKNYYYQLLLKTIIMSMIFYILISPVLINSLEKIKIVKKIGKTMTLSIIFGCIFFVLHLICI